jgi:hypothetical protein
MDTEPLKDHPGKRPGQRPRRLRLVRRAALAVTCLAGAGALLLAASGTAFATVDQTSPQWAEIGPDGYSGDQSSQVTAVYTIQNVAEPGTEMLEDNGNNMNQGGVIDVWHQIYQTTNQNPDGGAEITQANYLWEFVPSNPADGTQITQVEGELINRQSGLCLDLDGNSTADGAAIEQWPCNAQVNQQWIAVPVDGNYYLAPYLDYYDELSEGITPSLGIGNGTICTVTGDGDSVYARTTGTAGNLCDEWTIQQAPYDFATYAMGVTEGHLNPDNRAYECVPSDKFVQTGFGIGPEEFVFNNLSDSGVSVTFGPGLADSSSGMVAGQTFEYFQDTQSGSGPNGQVMLYCDPQQTAP